ncbi:MAG: substrate-binding domain-containing protein [Ruminococcus sp.]|nr:substrate-binding domain-containing protein [Ruminococcus sp.]
MNRIRKLLMHLPLILICTAAAAVAVTGIYAGIVYLRGKDMVEDRTGNSNVNVMLTRPEDWHRIQSGSIYLRREDLARIDGSTATIPITAELARQFCNASDDEIDEYVDHNTTHWAYENLMQDKKKDIIFVTEPSEYERQEADDLGIELDITPIALDGFVFITHKDNPVDSLTTEQIQGIYSGSITNWSEVGGADERIIPYQRERNSGSQTAMENMVMKDVPLMKPAESYIEVEGMGDLVEHIAEYENRNNSIGYTYYYYINNLYKSDDIKVLAINGVTPDNENLISGKYPYSTAYYAVMRKGQYGMAPTLRDYLLTDEGQEIIELAGYCPVGGEEE